MKLTLIALALAVSTTTVLAEEDIQPTSINVDKEISIQRAEDQLQMVMNSCDRLKANKKEQIACIKQGLDALLVK